ncbi:undecaprenyl diphosphate synthase family protein [Streptomyces sp. NPDC058486]|uniref:undecaprenyl diphosphate synthase family protein n=1 Tax=unclassified Streptomyces TaxID=2593676 RepID=UPI003668F45F
MSPVRRVLLIPDGTRRWCTREGQELSAGYLKAAEKIALTADYLCKHGATELVVALSSKNNLMRSPEAIGAYLEACLAIPQMCTVPVRMAVSGDLDLLEEPYRSQLIAMTREHSSGFHITQMQGWSLDHEVVRIVNALRNSPAPVTTESIAQVADLPRTIDLVVRTGGDHRLSSFVPLLSPYVELAFIDTLIPDLDVEDLRELHLTYKNKARRFGV